MDVLLTMNIQKCVVRWFKKLIQVSDFTSPVEPEELHWRQAIRHWLTLYKQYGKNHNS